MQSRFQKINLTIYVQISIQMQKDNFKKVEVHTPFLFEKKNFFLLFFNYEKKLKMVQTKSRHHKRKYFFKICFFFLNWLF